MLCELRKYVRKNTPDPKTTPETTPKDTPKKYAENIRQKCRTNYAGLILEGQHEAPELAPTAREWQVEEQWKAFGRRLAEGEMARAP